MTALAIEWRSPPPKRGARAATAPEGGPRTGQDRRDALGAVFGSPTPRIATRRPVGPSRGESVALWAAETLGVDLMPWQRFALDHGLVMGDDRWASRTVSIMVGRQNGKTMLTAVRALAGMALWGEEVLAASQNRDVALDAWNVALELAEDGGLPVHGISRTNGREAFHIGRARYKVVSSTRRGGRGLSADLVILDEVREYREWAGWAALEKTRRARRSSQVWAISNEGDDGSVVLISLAERGRNAAATGEATDAAWLEWSAHPDAQRSDPEAWCAANPAIGHLIDLDTVASESRTDDPEVFETEVLCRRVASLRPWMVPGLWEACSDPNALPPGDGAPVVFALAAGDDFRHATIAVAHKRDDGRVFVESVAAYLASDGDVLPRAAIRLADLAQRWQPAAVLVIAKTASEAAARRVLDGTETPVVALGGADLMRASEAFREGVIARHMVHTGDPMTAAHFGALTADGVLRPRARSADVDAAVAIVLAAWGTGAAPARTPSQDWVAF